MDFLIALVIMTAIVFFGRNAIKRFPWVFYILALTLSGLYLYSRFLAEYNPLLSLLMEYPQRGLLGMAVFTLIMFTGVFAQESRIRQWIEPIRAELSILGCLFIAGHAIGYLASYVQSISPGLLTHKTVIISLAISLVLLVLLLILGITTLVVVRKHMNFTLWKRTQRLSYLFYGLAFLHILLMLLPSALRGVEESIFSLSIYLLIAAVYLVMRIRRAYLDKTTRKTHRSDDGVVSKSSDGAVLP